ncbi:hypothetical protein LP420_19995 [Massilia sp. B-10]|nr:hypothetical protein LP420_19995 [Massilia sp. B-10]
MTLSTAPKHQQLQGHQRLRHRGKQMQGPEQLQGPWLHRHQGRHECLAKNGKIIDLNK